MAAEFNIEVQRNADYYQNWQFTDDAGNPIDLTGTTFKLEVKTSAGVVAGEIAVAVITVIDAVNGLISVRLNGEGFTEVPGVQEKVILAYDFLAIQDDVAMPLARGSVILLPGVSD